MEQNASADTWEFKMSPFQEGWTAPDIEAALAANDPEVLLHIRILGSLNPSDCAWAESICLRLAQHADANVRGNAILGFGHLARLCGVLDKARVRPLVAAALKDESEYVRGQADAAASDINFFLGWKPRFKLL